MKLIVLGDGEIWNLIVGETELDGFYCELESLVLGNGLCLLQMVDEPGVGVRKP